MLILALLALAMQQTAGVVKVDEILGSHPEWVSDHELFDIQCTSAGKSIPITSTILVWGTTPISHLGDNLNVLGIYCENPWKTLHKAGIAGYTGPDYTKWTSLISWPSDGDRLGIRGLTVFVNVYWQGVRIILETADANNAALYLNPDSHYAYSKIISDPTQAQDAYSRALGITGRDLICPDQMIVTGYHGHYYPGGANPPGIVGIGLYCDYVQCVDGSTVPTGGCSCKAGWGKSTGRSLCTICTSGTYRAGSTDGMSCKTCTNGVTPGSSPTGAIYSSPEGATTLDSCTSICNLGFEKPGGLTVCKGCDKGTFKSITGDSLCSACLPGTFSGSSGATVCTSCTTGSTYVANSGASVCLPCATTTPNAGYYLSECTTTTPSTLTSCTATSCDPGTYKSHNCPYDVTTVRRTPPTCERCPVGMFTGSSTIATTVKPIVPSLFFLCAHVFFSVPNVRHWQISTRVRKVIMHGLHQPNPA